jgi:C1A family cysteine protease
MNKAALLALIALSIGLLHLAEIGDQEENHGFSQFQVEYQKKYLREGEEQYRKQVFLKNVQNINKHNSDPQQTYTQGVNQFTDLTPEEFKALYLGLNLQRPSSHSDEVQVEDLVEVSTDIDWVAAGKVNPIQDQGQCGASWAFSAVAAIESAYMIKGTKQIKLSEQ